MQYAAIGIFHLRAGEAKIIIAAAMKTTTEQIIGTREAAEIIGMSQRWVQMESENGGRLSHLAQRAGRWFVFRRSDIEEFAEEYNAVPDAQPA